MQETEDYMSYAVPLSFHESTFIHSRIRDKSLYPLLVTVESVCSYSHLCFLFYYKRFQAAAPRRVLQILSAVSHQTTALCAPVPVYYSLSKHFSYYSVLLTLTFPACFVNKNFPTNGTAKRTRSLLVSLPDFEYVLKD